MIEGSILIDYMNNGQFNKVIEFITEQFGIDVNEAAQILRLTKEELKELTEGKFKPGPVSKLGIFCEFARMGIDGKFKVSVDAFVNSANASALSKICGVSKEGLENPLELLNSEEKYRLSIGLFFLFSMYHVDTLIQNEETIKAQMAQEQEYFSRYLPGNNP